MPSAPILIIDDDELSRELLVLMLAAEGHSVQAHASGDEALAALQASVTPPQAILTDLQMPGLCGNPLAQQLRALAPQARLLAISARQVEPEDVSAFDGFLLKPFTPDQLRDALAATRPPAAPAPSTSSSEEPILDQATFQRLSAGMKPDQLRQLFSLALADAARRATLLQAAAGSGDEAAFIREAHALQGGCGMIGALQLRSLVRDMENQGLSSASRLPEIPIAIARLQRMLEGLFDL